MCPRFSRHKAEAIRPGSWILVQVVELSLASTPGGLGCNTSEGQLESRCEDGADFDFEGLVKVLGVVDDVEAEVEGPRLAIGIAEGVLNWGVQADH